MTTKVIILCPDNSVHDVLVHVEDRAVEAQEGQPEGAVWVRNGQPMRVEPREQSEPVYLTATTRVVVEEAARAENAT